MSKKTKHSKILGTDYDPNNDISLDVKPDGDCEVKYKGQKMDYMTYVDEIEERATRKGEGKKPVKSFMGLFSGWGKGTLKKSYEE